MRSTIVSVSVFLTALVAASSAHAGHIDLAVTPPPGQYITQIRIEQGCGGACAPPAGEAEAPAPAPEELKPAKPSKPRKSKCASELETCNAQRAQLEADLAAARAERDAVRGELTSCTEGRGKCEAELAEVGKRIDSLEGKIRELEAAMADKPAAAPPPAAPPQGRGSSRGRRGVAPAAAAQGPEEDFSPIKIRGRLTTP